MNIEAMQQGKEQAAIKRKQEEDAENARNEALHRQAYIDLLRIRAENEIDWINT